MKTEENKNKNRYTQEFKDSMVKLVAESNEPMSKIATDVGINKKTLYGWIMKEKSSQIQLDKAMERNFSLPTGNRRVSYENR